MKKLYIFLVAILASICAQAGTYNIKFTNPDNWETVKVYVWNGPSNTNNGWPGQQMIQNGDVWEITLNTTFDITNIQFNNGGDSAKCEPVWSGEGTYDKSGIYGSTAINIALPGQHNGWNESTTLAGEDGIVTFTNVALGTSEFKVKVNGQWYATQSIPVPVGEWVALVDGGNVTVKDAAADSKYDVTIDGVNKQIKLTLVGDGDDQDENDGWYIHTNISGDWSDIKMTNRASGDWYAGPVAATIENWEAVFKYVVEGKPVYYSVAKNEGSFHMITLGATVDLLSSDYGNMKYAKKGEYNFTIDPVNMTVTVDGTPEEGGDEPDPVVSYTIYYDNSATNWSSVYFYYWNDPKAPGNGDAMTPIDSENNIWAVTVEKNLSTCEALLFNSGSWSDTTQTADFKEAPKNGWLYKGAGGNKGAVTAVGEYDGGEGDGDDDDHEIVIGGLTMETPKAEDCLEAYYLTDFVEEKNMENPILSTVGSHTSTAAHSWVKFSDLTDNDLDNDEILNNTTTTHTCLNAQDAFYRVYMEHEVSPFVTASDRQRVNASHKAYAARVARTTAVDGHDTTTGVEEIVSDVENDEDAAVVYYNLQGVRVENPSNGVFIRVQGNKVTKELIK